MEQSFTNIGELLKILSKKNYNSINNTYCFRGEAKDFGSSSLLPSLLRIDGCNKVLERNLFKAFCDRGYDQIPADIIDKDVYKLALSQHYQLPSRLLDWSTNPLISLYFCVEDSHLTRDEDQDDAMFYALPYEKNLLSIISMDEFSKKNFHDIQQDEHSYLGTSRNFILFRFPDICERIKHQSGLFSIHSLIKKDTPHISKDDGLIKFRIPKYAKKDILIELNALNINKSTVYCTLSDIAYGIKNAFTNQ